METLIIKKCSIAGDWIIECRTNSHLTGGMRALYRVEDCSSSRQRRQTFEYTNEIESRVEYSDDVPKDIPLGDKVLYNSNRESLKKKVPSRDGKIREYFVAAVEEEWEYAPKDRHLVLGGSLMNSE